MNMTPTFSVRESRRRRGRPRIANAMVSMSLRVPADIFDAYCARARATNKTLPEVVREALRERQRVTAPCDFSS